MHCNTKDLRGKRFGKLVARQHMYVNTTRGKKSWWMCDCDCGKVTTVAGNMLLMNETKSCGCLLHAIKGKDITGMKFKYLTVLGRNDGPCHKRWKCQCVCGKIIYAPRQPLISGRRLHCGCKRAELFKPRSGAANPSYKGGKCYDNDGYVQVLKPVRQPYETRYTKEHVLVMSQAMGRKLATHETVHHRNGIRDDNRLENLELWNKNHPSGQRVADKLRFYIEQLQLYWPVALNQAVIKGKSPFDRDDLLPEKGLVNAP